MTEENEAVENTVVPDQEQGPQARLNLTRRQFARYTTAIGMAAALGTNVGGSRTALAEIADYPYRLDIQDKCKVTLVVCGELAIKCILQEPIFSHIGTYITNAETGAKNTSNIPVARRCGVAEFFLRAIRDIIEDNTNLHDVRFRDLFLETKSEWTIKWGPEFSSAMFGLAGQMTLPFHSLPDQTGTDTPRKRAHELIVHQDFGSYLNSRSLKQLFTTSRPETPVGDQSFRLTEIGKAKNNHVFKDFITPIHPVAKNGKCWDWSLNNGNGNCADSDRESDYCENINGLPSEMSDICGP